MKIMLLILLTTCTLLKAEPQRRKIHSSTQQYNRRYAPPQQFMKKWHQPPRPPVRTRSPIPVHMPPSHKIPMGILQSASRPISKPVRNFWKNTQSNTKFITPDKGFQKSPLVPEKPFLTAPSLAIQDFDYHLQTNNIPVTQIKPIKQVGEKGPIHTIPAPNLSLRDKPIFVEEVNQQLNYKHHLPHLNVEQKHQYQVTEQPEPNVRSRDQQQFHQKQFHQQLQLEQQQRQQLLQQQLQQNQQTQQNQQLLQNQQFQQNQKYQQKQQFQQQPQLTEQHLIQQQLQQQIQQQITQHDQLIDVQLEPHNVQLSHQQFFLHPKNSDSLPQKPEDLFLKENLSPNELYQILGANYPEATISNQPQQQSSEPDYQAIYNQNFFKPEQTFDLKSFSSNRTKPLFQAEQTFDLKTAATKPRFQPEFHSFNYDEQAHQASQNKLTKQGMSSLVTAGYNLDSGVFDPNIKSRKGTVEPELIQSYFSSRSDLDRNNVEHEAKPTEEKQEMDKIEEKLSGESFYSSLPSKEVADRLAKLHAAGKVNSNLMELSQNSPETTNIYITEEHPNENVEDKDIKLDNENLKEQLVEYDEYSQEDAADNLEEENVEFGHKTKAKKDG